MPKKILWLSSHTMNGIQMSALRRMYGTDVVLVPKVGWLGNAEQIVSAYRASGCDDVIIVAPMSVIARVVELGVHPLWSEAVICPKGQHDWETNGRYYRFARFRRIRRLAFEFEDLGPAAQRQTTDTVGGGEPSLRPVATIPADVIREYSRGGLSREAMETIQRIACESAAAELLYLKPEQREHGGDHVHPDCRVYSIPGKMRTGRKWYWGEPKPHTVSTWDVVFTTRLVIDPGTLSSDEAICRVVEHHATIEFEAGMVKWLICGEGPYKGATLKQVTFGQKSEERLVSADGTVIGWGIMPTPKRQSGTQSGTWIGMVQLRLFHEPYPPEKMIRL